MSDAQAIPARQPQVKVQLAAQPQATQFDAQPIATLTPTPIPQPAPAPQPDSVFQTNPDTAATAVSVVPKQGSESTSFANKILLITPLAADAALVSDMQREAYWIACSK